MDGFCHSNQSDYSLSRTDDAMDRLGNAIESVLGHKFADFQHLGYWLSASIVSMDGGDNTIEPMDCFSNSDHTVDGHYDTLLRRNGDTDIRHIGIGDGFGFIQHQSRRGRDAFDKLDRCR